MMGIYQINNIINGKKYIGSSVNIMSRWEQHLNNLNYNTHHSHLLQKDWDKYSIQDFAFQVLEVVEDKRKLLEREQDWIDSEDFENLYNVIDYVNYKSISYDDNIIHTYDYSQRLDNEIRINLINNLNIYKKTHSLMKIGNGKHDLSKAWFIKDDNGNIETLRKSISNYFKNKISASYKDVAWTTFIGYYNKVKSQGNAKSFVSITSNLTEENKRQNLCFAMNVFPNSFLKRKIENDLSLKVNDDQYALSIMLQWIIGVTDINKQINIYIPSDRMENILSNWIDESK